MFTEQEASNASYETAQKVFAGEKDAIEEMTAAGFSPLDRGSKKLIEFAAPKMFYHLAKAFEFANAAADQDYSMEPDKQAVLAMAMATRAIVGLAKKADETSVGEVLQKLSPAAAAAAV